MADHIKVDGTVIPVRAPAPNGRFTLAELQAFVGGYIEIVYRGAAFDMRHDKTVMVVNEMGWVSSPPLPLNELASIFAGQPIAGDVLICKFGLEID